MGTVLETAKACRHCGGDKVNRPRGLCWSCYYTPGVKALYPSTSKHAPKSPPAVPVCWGCGRQADRRQGLARDGWRVRLTRVLAGQRKERECYCPACFAAWGWPPETVYGGLPGDAA